MGDGQGMQHAAWVGETTDTYGILVGKLHGKWPLWKPRRGWEDNTKMNLT